MKQQLADAEQHAGSSGGLLALQQRVAEAEEELRLLSEKQQRQHSLLAQLEQAGAAVRQLAAARSQVGSELAACQLGQRKVVADLQLAETEESGAALLASLMAEEDRLAAAVRAKQQAVAAVAQGAEGLASQLRVLLAEQQRLAAIPKVAGASSSNASGAGLLAWQQEQQHELASLQGRLQQHRAGLQLLQRQEQRLQLEAGTLAARLGSSTPGGGAAASVAWRPLHRCFALKDPQQSRAQAQALQVLGGGKLGVVVADSMEAAGKLLAAGVGARIWPLDSLSAADHQAQHARAAQHFAQGRHIVFGCQVAQAPGCCNQTLP